ncbi:LysR substrate-binding domain-containing protein [Phenylobacterium sp.]|jgi:DNA-binding transcriptional LysR family regulator|uniref:LysR substrate-binding domain-containing protein n=1 Tax=Phenylobacterium sp. TaxID=1871053 RepID=UPI002F92C28B
MSGSDTPPLSSLRAFEAVVRLGSVTRAAQELGRTHGAVSKQLRSLRAHLGASLFERAGAGLAPTPAALRLAAALGDGFARIYASYREAAQEVHAPRLHIACSVTFATRWLAPNLADFSREHPQVRVRLSMTSADRLRLEGADLVISWDWRSFGPADQARAERIAEVAFGPVCRPEHPIDAAGDVLTTPVLITHEVTRRAWDVWQAASGVALAARETIAFPHTHLGIEAALSGMGVVLVEKRLVARELAEGRLIAPYGFTPFPDGLAAIVADAAPRGPVDAFLAWSRRALAATA